MRMVRVQIRLEATFELIASVIRETDAGEDVGARLSVSIAAGAGAEAGVGDAAACKASVVRWRCCSRRALARWRRRL